MDIHADLTAPLLVQSSKSLNWGDDLEVRRYLEPDTIDGWTDPVSPQIIVLLLSHGAMRMEFQRSKQWKQLHVKQGDAFLKPADAVTAVTRWNRTSREPMQTRHLLLSRELLNRCAEELADRNPARIDLVGRSGFQDAMLTHIGLALQHEMDNPSPMSKLYAETASHLLAVHLLRHYGTERVDISTPSQGLTPPQLRRVTEFINAHLADDLSLSVLADLVTFSPYHFARLFRQTTGESVHQFVLHKRLEQAQHLLRKTDLTIAQIALCSGFAHQSHLTRAFHKHFKLTPHAYRQAYSA